MCVPEPMSSDKCQRSFSQLSLNLETSLRMKCANFSTKQDVDEKFAGTESEFIRVLDQINDTIRFELKRRKMAKYRSRI